MEGAPFLAYGPTSYQVIGYQGYEQISIPDNIIPGNRLPRIRADFSFR